MKLFDLKHNLNVCWSQRNPYFCFSGVSVWLEGFEEQQVGRVLPQNKPAVS